VFIGSGLAVLFLLAFFAPGVAAFPCRPALIPNGAVNACSTCHVSPRGSGPRNLFGNEIEADTCASFWNEALACRDSDGDGRTNGEELLDPDGLWRPGRPSPGHPALVTNPGVSPDVRPVVVNIRSFPRSSFATIQWDTDKPSSSVVEFGKTDALQVGRVASPELTTSHSVRLEGLTPATVYRYRVSSATPGEHVTTVPLPSQPAATFTTSGQPEPPASGFLRGDVNGDGSVDIADSVRALDALFSPAGRLDCEDAADVNDDGLIDVSDVVFALLALLGAGEPPAPGPLSCGGDSTDDALDCEVSICDA
ncbi:MAG: hypothetical protein L0206_15550, partial [Actinobacteria bacterium]|nr:hypothetical protein [Actinomycetota bacterium]